MTKFNKLSQRNSWGNKCEKDHKATNYHDSKFIRYIFIIVIVLYVNSSIKSGIEASNRYKSKMYRDFERFGIELETLDDRLCQLINDEKYDFAKEKEFINDYAIREFYLSDYRALDMERKKGPYREYGRMYSDINKNIFNIADDKKITLSEKKYLETLYEYNDELI